MTAVAERRDAPAPDRAILLRTSGLTKRFGGVLAIDALDLTLHPGEICGVIGPNGAGKTTLIGLLSGGLPPSAGRIEFEGADITRLSGPHRAQRGIGRTYQIPRPFLDMTVRENLLAAQFALAPLKGRRQAQDECQRILERTGLANVAGLPARSLPLLRRKRLEMARALALRPKLLLLDEVGAGLIDSEVSELITLIRSLADEISGILIIEHVIRVVRECCRRLVVLNFGRKLLEGTAGEVLASDHVAAVYLGTAHAGTAARVPEKAEEGSAVTPSLRGLREVLAPVAVSAAGEDNAAPLLALTGISAGYGQARVLDAIDLSVMAGQVVAVLGANGAGKTTLAAVIGGLLKPTAGRMLIAGTDVTGAPAHRIARQGIAQCLEGRRIFAPLSVEENLLIAARGVTRAEQQRRLDAVYGLFPILAERRRTPGVSMSGGQQQMLALGRTLMARPRLVVFDEISLGLAPLIVDQLYEALRELHRAGLTMLVVEQDVDRALRLADRVYVLERGRIALSGTAQEIRADRRLRNLYIGEADDAAPAPHPSAGDGDAVALHDKA